MRTQPECPATGAPMGHGKGPVVGVRKGVRNGVHKGVRRHPYTELHVYTLRVGLLLLPILITKLCCPGSSKYQMAPARGHGYTAKWG